MNILKRFFGKKEEPVEKAEAEESLPVTDSQWLDAAMDLSNSDSNWTFPIREGFADTLLAEMIDHAKWEILVEAPEDWRKSYPQTSMRLKAFKGAVEKLDAEWNQNLKGKIALSVIVDRKSILVISNGEPINLAGNTSLINFNHEELKEVLTIKNI